MTPKREVEQARDDQALIARYFADIREPTDAERAEVVQRLIGDILAAESFDETFTRSNLTPFTQYLNKPVEVLGVRWNQSRFEGGVPVYAVAEIVDLETGEKVTVGCSGTLVVAALRKWEVDGWLPARCTLVESPETTRGFRPQRLIPAEPAF